MVELAFKAVPVIPGIIFIIIHAGPHVVVLSLQLIHPVFIVLAHFFLFVFRFGFQVVDLALVLLYAPIHIGFEFVSFKFPVPLCLVLFGLHVIAGVTDFIAHFVGLMFGFV